MVEVILSARPDYKTVRNAGEKKILLVNRIQREISHTGNGIQISSQNSLAKTHWELLVSSLETD